MVDHYCDDRLITSTSVRAFFQDSVTEAIHNQGVEATQDTVQYVVGLLTLFTRSEELYEQTADGPTVRPLALLYKDAVESRNNDDRNRSLRRLGDVALFISGVFTDSLNRRVVDVDYYISMGGSAYGHLSDVLRGSLHGRALGQVFEELSTKFTEFVDILGEVSERAHINNDSDIMRLYEVWMRTGSDRLARRLRALGIDPVPASTHRVRH